MNFPTTRKIDFENDFSVEINKVCYGNILFCQPVDYEVSGADTVNTKTLGDYEIDLKASFGEKELNLAQIVSVVDRKPPEISTSAETVSVCSNGKIQTFDLAISDNYDGDLTDTANLTVDNDEVIISVTDSSHNTAEKRLPATVEDLIAPVLTLEGNEPMTVYIGDQFSDPGATAVDNCDDAVTVDASGMVDASTPGSYTLTYTSKDSSGNEASLTRLVNVTSLSGTIYLTFDDGPGEYTNELLDILKKYGIKATFFVTGSGSDEILRREYEEGHQIGLHTFSHNYSYIYTSKENFFADLYAVQERVKNATGYTSKIIRFPGGSSNTVSAYYDGGIRIMSQLVNDVEAKGFRYFDWNISSGDAGGALTSDAVYDNVVSRLTSDGNYVVLQHDIKEFSVEAVARIIEYGQSHGYAFKRLELDSFDAHRGVNN